MARFLPPQKKAFFLVKINNQIVLHINSNNNSHGFPFFDIIIVRAGKIQTKGAKRDPLSDPPSKHGHSFPRCRATAMMATVYQLGLIL